MKKVLMMVAATLFVGGIANAQFVNLNKKTKKECCKKSGKSNCASMPFKAQKGDITTDLNFLGNNEKGHLVPISLDDKGLNVRYFVDDNVALRASLLLKGNKTSMKYEDDEEAHKTSNNDLSLGIGAAYHFAGTKRLSPYVGAEFLVTRGIMSNTYKDNTTKSKEFGVGGYIFSGADYYIAKHLYLGIESGLVVIGDFSGNELNGKSVGDSKAATTYTPYLSGGFKLGFVF